MDDATALVTVLRDAAAGVDLEPVPSLDGQPTIYVPREQAELVLRALHDRPELGFRVLIELTAVDYWPREPRFELVYILLAPARRARARVRVRLNNDRATARTVSGIWPAANWLEREVWDLFGIEFEGHPDPRRLLMPEDWEGFPLRKDYPVQIQLKPRTTEPTQVTEEEFRANMARDRLVRQP